LDKTTPDGSENGAAGLRLFANTVTTTVRFYQKCWAETWTLEFVILGGIVEFSFR
jgi:hypothetical protein